MHCSYDFFEETHASWKTELFGLPCGIEDSKAVLDAKRSLNYAELGKAYTNQLRYTDAAAAYSMELDSRGESLSVLRQRAGKYLATLQLSKARKDFLRCAELGADEVDVGYRLGLCEYYCGNYEKAMEYLNKTLPSAGDEMGIAIIFWHTMSAFRAGTEAGLLCKYRDGMQVGHHTGYEKAVRLCAGAVSLTDALLGLCGETEDLEFSIAAYGAARYLIHIGMAAEGERLLEFIRKRDGFWVSFGFLAAVNDSYGGTGCIH